MTFTTPCARPENDPNDWFIEKDGKQYGDEILVPIALTDLTEGQLEFVTASVQRQTSELARGESLDQQRSLDIALEELKDHIVADRLVKRRHAKDACFVECIFRLDCLGKGESEDHGTWGGYYAEERRKIADLRAAKIAERLAAAQMAAERRE